MAESAATISGLVSGIDWATTIEQLMAIEARPLNLLQQRKTEYETKLSMWNQLNTKLQSLQSASSNLVEKNAFASRSASSSDTDVVSVSASGSASPGNHVISAVNSLARANNFVAASSYASADSTFGQAAGSFTINLADHPDGAQTIALAFGTDYSASTSLDEFCDLINNHPDNEGLVNASIINNGSGATPYKLVITAANTGTDYRITSIADTSTGLGMAQGLTAQDLSFTIDTIAVTKNSNIVDDVVDGVTFNFISDNLVSDIFVNVDNDKATLKSNINSVINAYNDVKSFINLVTKYDTENETVGPLLGDGNVASVRSKLESIISNTIPGLASSARFKSLGEIGISTSADTGELEIDDDELDDALEENFDAVADVFCEKASSTNTSISYVKRTMDTEAGEYSVVANYNGSGALTSATINGVTASIFGSLIQGASGTNAEGLLLKFTWPGSGASQSSTIRLSLGTNAQFEKEIDYITGEEFQEGEYYWAKDSLQDTIDSYEEQISKMAVRLNEKQEQYERQFNQLETLISQLKSQSSYLSSILS